MTEVEEAFVTLKVDVDRMQRQTKARVSWISQDTWSLAERQAALQRTGRASATETIQARRELLLALHADRQKIVQEEVATIESLMETGKVQEAWLSISQWYMQARGVQDPPNTEALDEVSMERADLYTCRPSVGLRFPILVHQSDIDDGIPMETEVETEVRGLKGGRVGDLPGMRS